MFCNVLLLIFMLCGAGLETTRRAEEMNSGSAERQNGFLSSSFFPNSMPCVGSMKQGTSYRPTLLSFSSFLQRMLGPTVKTLFVFCFPVQGLDVCSQLPEQ